MEANPRDLLRVFQPDIQYVVPIFQRRYVWTEDGQWAELWEDLVEMIEDVERAEKHRDEGADVPLPSHFLGAIVCDQSLSTGSDIDERPLIDGQQRLTTLQLILAAALSVARRHAAEQAIGLLSKLVENDAALVDRSHDAFKVWPSDPDRAAFSAVMSGEDAEDVEHRLAQGFSFFKSRLDEWVGDSDPNVRLSRLARALRKHVELVVIDLQPGDNAQVIFESLNYGGRELTAIDLVKNHVFFRAANRPEIDLHQLHSGEWEPFDQDWWRHEVSQGRLYRARAELFLMHWLKLEKLEEIKAHRLFVEFRDLPALDADLEETVRRLAADRDLYRRCEEDPASLNAPTGGFFPRLESIEQSTPRPVTLQLLRAVPDVIAPARAARAFHALDSYLWRRTLMNRTTANYNRLMLDILEAIEEDMEHADDMLIATLAGLEGHAVDWPRDEELRNDLEVRALYGRGRVKVRRLATALRLVENRWRRPRGEGPLAADAELQIEHLLPQEWETHWPVAELPVESLPDREQDRRAHLHRLGNLTLVSPTMNPALSNSAWQTKRGHLREHSTALITTRYLDGEYAEAWDEGAIRKRGAELIDAVLEIWPGPGGELRQPVSH